MNHSRIGNLRAQRRFNQMELAQEKDPQMKKALVDHIAQLDDDIIKIEYDDEITQVIPRITMRRLVYGVE